MVLGAMDGYSNLNEPNFVFNYNKLAPPNLDQYKREKINWGGARATLADRMPMKK